MKAAGKTYEPVTYEGAGHGFMRAGDAPATSAGRGREDERGVRGEQEGARRGVGAVEGGIGEFVSDE